MPFFRRGLVASVATVLVAMPGRADAAIYAEDVLKLRRDEPAHNVRAGSAVAASADVAVLPPRG